MPDLKSLDDLSIYGSLDPEGMLAHLHAFPYECAKACDMAMRFPLPPELRSVNGVVVLGMGGSAIGGDLVASLAEAHSKVPVRVCRGYTPPAHADRNTLVMASSYSGNTEETLACFEQSLERGCCNLAITTGGKLKHMASRGGVPVFGFDYASPPRAALPYSFMAILCFLRRLGLLQDSDSDLDETMEVLKEQGGILDESMPTAENPAKQLAHYLADRLSVIYGAEFLSEVAHRWKTQINENSKAWAFHEVFPELNHNAVVGFKHPASINRHVCVAMLESPSLSPRVRLRYDVTQKLLDRAGIEYRRISAPGRSQVAQMMGLILLGDYVSYYLAILNGERPTPVDAIDYLKSELARFGDA